MSKKKYTTSGAVRRAKMLQLAAKGKTVEEIAGELGQKRQTVYNGLVQARRETPIKVEDRARLVAEADTELRALKDFILQSDEMTDKEIVDAIRGVWKDLREMHGVDEPDKRLVGHVHDAENLGPYRKFVLAVRGLDESQIEELLTAARAVPRKIRPMPQPPKTSPLWTNQLGDGHVD